MNENINQLEIVIKDQLIELAKRKTRIEDLEQEKHDLLKNNSLEIIETLDTFEIIEEGLKEKMTDDSEKIVKRFKILEKKLTNLLNKNGITKIDFPENKLISGYCKVVDTEPDTSKKDNYIISIVRNGYIRGKELIREAEVIIIKN